MTQEQKELLLKDLCARLPYGIKLLCPDAFGGYTSILEEIDIYNWIKDSEGYIYEITEVKPYLFPIESMTDEQSSEFMNIQLGYPSVDWFNKNHFDYRGLIPMGLAEDATGLNIY